MFAAGGADAGDDVHRAMRRIAQEGRGVLVYVRGGHSAGLGEELRAAQRMNGSGSIAARHEGAEESDGRWGRCVRTAAPCAPGHWYTEQDVPLSDTRSLMAAALVLRELSVQSARVLTDSPAEFHALSGLGTRLVGREPFGGSTTGAPVGSEREGGGHM